MILADARASTQEASARLAPSPAAATQG
jgi:hypothetical protein